MTSGFLAIDKPAGASSHDVVRSVKRLFQTHQVGHTGTLDPIATGMLIVALGEATKFIPYISNQTKTYVTEALLGITSNSFDTECPASHSFHVPENVEESLRAFIQNYPSSSVLPIPPYSACKFKGKPLYYYARKGIMIHLSHRQYDGIDLQLISMDGKTFRMKIQCPSGTYIRSIIQDIGVKLKTGAVMTQLRRIQNGPIAQMSPLNETLRNNIIPIETVLQYPKVEIDTEQLIDVSNGKPIHFLAAPLDKPLYSLMHRNVFVGVAALQKPHELKIKRLLKREIILKRIENP